MARITVVGLGYIGLPTAATLAAHGHQVAGYDVNKALIDRLRQGEITIEEPGLLAFVQAALASGRLVPSDTLAPADVYVVCVPSPVDHESKRADLSYVETASKALVPLLKPGDLVVLETTVPPGTTERVMAPILATSGLDPRRDLHVAHCPETVLPGNMIVEMAQNHRVVGGLTGEATRAARDLYATFVRGEIVATDATTAEFVKLIENTYRDVNIALANELAVLAREIGVDAREAIRIANKHPRVHLHKPGPGVGGHCIPVDPWFLIQLSPRVRLMRAAREVNDAMPAYVAGLVQGLVGSVPRPRIAVLGLAYKGNIDDVRDSPAFDVVRLLRERLPGCEIRLNDPHVPQERHPSLPLDEALDGADCVVLVTDHAEYAALDPAAVAARARSRNLVDTRGMLRAEDWRREGFRVETI